MITIRPLNKSEIYEAMQLKIISWTEELADRVKNTMSFVDEVAFWTEWTDNAQSNGDIRLLIGAFDKEELVGIAAGSLADYKDVKENGIELKFIAVKKEHRGHKFSVRMILYILDFFIPLGATQMIIYSHHYAQSNTYYQKFGAQLLRKEFQLQGKLEVDVFIISTVLFRNKLLKSLY